MNEPLRYLLHEIGNFIHIVQLQELHLDVSRLATLAQFAPIVYLEQPDTICPQKLHHHFHAPFAAIRWFLNNKNATCTILSCTQTHLTLNIQSKSAISHILNFHPINHLSKKYIFEINNNTITITHRTIP